MKLAAHGFQRLALGVPLLLLGFTSWRAPARRVTVRSGGRLTARDAPALEEWLDLEGTAAAARGFHVRIIELEPGTFEGLDIVDFSAIEV